MKLISHSICYCANCSCRFDRPCNRCTQCHGTEIHEVDETLYHFTDIHDDTRRLEVTVDPTDADPVTMIMKQEHTSVIRNGLIETCVVYLSPSDRHSLGMILLNSVAPEKDEE